MACLVFRIALSRLVPAIPTPGLRTHMGRLGGMRIIARNTPVVSKGRW